MEGNSGLDAGPFKRFRIAICANPKDEGDGFWHLSGGHVAMKVHISSFHRSPVQWVPTKWLALEGPGGVATMLQRFVKGIVEPDPQMTPREDDKVR